MAAGQETDMHASCRKTCESQLVEGKGMTDSQMGGRQTGGRQTSGRQTKIHGQKGGKTERLAADKCQDHSENNLFDRRGKK